MSDSFPADNDSPSTDTEVTYSSDDMVSIAGEGDDDSREPLGTTEVEHTSSSSIEWSRVAPVDIDDPKSLELSAEFVGRWSTLVSTTNWEKGRIIAEWRDALIGSESPAIAYSDEAWSRRVGGVSPQHVGRLRRVFERFGGSYSSYAGVYWSHFLAALDWDDAELWLEGATQSNWSVSQMRRTRWESMGGAPEHEPNEQDISADGSIAGGMDDDFTPLAEAEDLSGAKDGPRSVAEGPRPDGPDFGDEDDNSPSAKAAADADDDALPWEDEATSTAPSESPFARLPSLPVDLAEALEQFKLAIIRHRADGWRDASQADVQQALDALKAFVSL
jgi:hypothetical protein